MITEYELLKEVATSITSRTGYRAELQYITAELTPYSSQHKPDLLVYYPNAKNCVIFIEFKISLMSQFKRNLLANFIASKEFVEETSELPIKYLFITNEFLSNEFITSLASIDILGYSQINNPREIENIIYDIINNDI